MEEKLLIFDADGTLRYCTVAGQPCPNSDGEWELYPDVRERLAMIRWTGPGEGDGVGYGMASNQGGVGAGYFSGDTAMNLLVNTFERAFGFSPAEGTVRMCPHHPRSGCGCRKPRPGMLHGLMELYGVGPAETLFVGDSGDDREAARRAGCRFMSADEFFGREGGG